MKRRMLLICIAALLLAGVWTPAGVFADADHPISMTILIDPDPELMGDGTIPDMLFTIRNSGSEDYTLDHAELSGGYEDRVLTLDEHITVLAGGTKEFHLNDVAVSDAQLDTTVTYRLSWTETEFVYDEETDATTTIVHNRETDAQVRVERFIPPELSVTASTSAARVRAGETFTVTYTIYNDTKFDMSGLKLYDPEQSMQSIGLPSSDLFAGERKSVEVTYTMGKEDMSFAPVVEYTVRMREQTTRVEEALTVESVVVDLSIEVEQYPATSDGMTFAVTVRNNGNRAVTGIQVFDEINTEIDEPFDLAPQQSKVVLYTVPSAISSDTIRKIRFHLTGVDSLDQAFTVTDSNQYEAIPYVASDSVNISLYVVLQRAYYDENGKLCGTIQFEIRNFSKVLLKNATLNELRLFGELQRYTELQNGETYFVTSLQLDGVPELSFRVDAYDPAGQRCTTDTVRLDLARLKELADQTDEPVYVYPTNPFFKDLDVKYRGILRTAGIIVSIVALVCAIICVVLYAIERRIKAKLPAQFEENMESALQSTKRRVEKPMFGEVPTEQFGYTVPIKMRSYGELTEQEAAERKQAYQEKLRENLREYGASAAVVTRTKPVEPTGADAFAGTRIVPAVRPASATVREDIRFIPVEPGPPKKKAEKQPPKKPQSVQKAQPAQKQPAQKPQPAKPQPAKPQTAQKPPVQKPVEPRVREQAGEARAPRLAQSIPAPSKRAVRETAFTRMKG